MHKGESNAPTSQRGGKLDSSGPSWMLEDNLLSPVTVSDNKHELLRLLYYEVDGEGGKDTQ